MKIMKPSIINIFATTFKQLAIKEISKVLDLFYILKLIQIFIKNANILVYLTQISADHKICKKTYLPYCFIKRYLHSSLKSQNQIAKNLMNKCQQNQQNQQDIYDSQSQELHQTKLSNQMEPQADQPEQNQLNINQDTNPYQEKPYTKPESRLRFSSNKKNSFNDESDDGWEELIKWSQANPTIMEKYSGFNFKDNILNGIALENAETKMFKNGKNKQRQLPEKDRPLKYELGQLQDQNYQDKQQNNHFQKDNKEQNHSKNNNDQNEDQKQFFDEFDDDWDLQKGKNYFDKYQKVDTERQAKIKKYQIAKDLYSRGEERWEGNFDTVIDYAINKANNLLESAETGYKPRIGRRPRGRPKPILQSEHIIGSNGNQRQVSTWLKKKKASKGQLRRDLFNIPSAQEQFQHIEHLNRSQQFAYVDSKISHYQRLKSLIIKNRSKDDAINRIFRGRQSKDSQFGGEGDQSQIVVGRKQKITPQLLRLLAVKYQLYNSYQNGKFEPDIRISLESIASQFQLKISTINSLYSQWLSDNNFSQKIVKLQKQNGIIEIPKKPRIMPNMFKRNSLLSEPSIPDNNTDKIIQMRKTYAEQFKKLKSKGARMYYLDECSKQVIMGVNRGEDESGNQGLNFSLMAVLGASGGASWKVVRWTGQKYQKAQDIEQLYRNVRQDEEVGFNQVVGGNIKSYLILDSIILKDISKVQRIEQLTNTKILFLPQFSRQLNPLDLWFADVRSRLRLGANSLNQLNRVLQIFSGTDFGKYLADTQRYMGFAIDKQQF